MRDISERMGEIEVRLKASAKGNWSWVGEDYRDGCDLRGRILHIGKPGEGPNSNWPLTTKEGRTADATCEFIAHSKTDIEWLIAQVREARAENLELVNRSHIERMALRDTTIERDKALKTALSLSGHLLDLARALKTMLGGGDPDPKVVEAVRKIIP